MKKFYSPVLDKGFEVKGCFGLKGCPNAVTSSSGLLKKLEDILINEGITEFIKHKVKGGIKHHNMFKVALSECPNGCSQIYIADFGVHGFLRFKVEEDECNLCGNCVEVCEEGVFELKENMLVFNEEKCVGCGLCVRACPKQALKVYYKGYRVYVGGKLGRHPRLATYLATLQNEEDLFKLFKKVLRFYKENNVKGERLGSIIQRTGWENFINSLKNYQEV